MPVPRFAQALRQAAALVGLALLPAFVSGAIQLTPHRATKAETITPAEIFAGKTEIVWVDARPAADYEAAHAAHAILLNAEDWDRQIPPFLDAWHPAKLVIVYDDGRKSDAAEVVARRLREELQMKNVRVLKGGWQRWTEQK